MDGDPDARGSDRARDMGMYFDGSLTKEGGAEIVFILPLGMRIEYMIRLHFPVSNNVAEYVALLNRL
jgi:hypothetical protein